MRERGVTVDHSTVNRWVTKYSPQMEEAFRPRKRPSPRIPQLAFTGASLLMAVPSSMLRRSLPYSDAPRVASRLSLQQPSVHRVRSIARANSG